MILGGLGLGVLLGLLALGWGRQHPAFLEAARQFSIAVLDPVGRIFLHLLFFVVIPLVFSTLALAVTQVGRPARLGTLATRTLGLFVINMVGGVVLGLALMNWLAPGAALGAEARQQIETGYGAQTAQVLAGGARGPALSFAVMVDMFLPRNLAQALVNFQLLPLIVFALLTGLAGTQLADSQRQRLEGGLQILADLMTRIVHYALWLAPVAVPAMVFSVLVRAGAEVLFALSSFVLICLAAMALHLFGLLSLMIRFLGRRSPWEFFRLARTVLVTAFSTSSSNATLPASLQAAREQFKLSPAVAGFVLPLGATMNMSGTALYEGCVVLFIAQVFGVPLGLAAQAALVLLAVLSAVAVAGIPGASLPLIAGLLFSFGVPPEGIGLIIGVDRLLDMARTTLNVAADLVTACIVDARWRDVSPTVQAPQ